jgi:uncharacterized membrane protein
MFDRIDPARSGDDCEHGQDSGACTYLDYDIAWPDLLEEGSEEAGSPDLIDQQRMVEVEQFCREVVVHGRSVTPHPIRRNVDAEQHACAVAGTLAGSQRGGIVREWVLLGHVLFGIIWMGGSVYVEALTANAKRRPDPIALGVLFRDTSAMNQRLFSVTASLTIAFGFWLIFITSVRFEMLWIVVSILLVGASITTDLFYAAPRSREALDIIYDKGAADPDAAVLIEQVITAGRLRSAVLLIVLFLMIFKPAF